MKIKRDNIVGVLCLIVVPLPPGANPFSVKINIYVLVLREH
jgi:hypothetical protein